MRTCSLAMANAGWPARTFGRFPARPRMCRRIRRGIASCCSTPGRYRAFQWPLRRRVSPASQHRFTGRISGSSAESPWPKVSDSTTSALPSGSGIGKDSRSAFSNAAPSIVSRRFPAIARRVRRISWRGWGRQAAPSVSTGQQVRQGVALTLGQSPKQPDQVRFLIRKVAPKSHLDVAKERRFDPCFACAGQSVKGTFQSRHDLGVHAPPVVMRGFCDARVKADR